jgi:hypothetical protein
LKIEPHFSRSKVTALAHVAEDLQHVWPAGEGRDSIPYVVGGYRPT